MITRPMSLLIIVGDEKTLNTDKKNNWQILVQYCRQNGAMLKEGRLLHPPIEAPTE